MIIAGVIDEEYSSIGARELIKEWTADAAVVGEPTDMSVAVGHKGFEWVEIDVEGRAAHGSRPLEGLDAILRMGRVLSRLERLDRELQSRDPHPLMGTASLHASLIEGGKEWSTYPDRCILKMERRTIAGESGEISLTEVDSIIRELRGEDSEFRANARYVFGQPPYETPADHPIAENLVKAVEGIGRKTERSSMTFWTDAAVLGQVGDPFGDLRPDRQGPPQHRRVCRGRRCPRLSGRPGCPGRRLLRVSDTCHTSSLRSTRESPAKSGTSGPRSRIPKATTRS